MNQDRSATDVMREAMPFCATLGARADRYTSEQVVLSLDWAPGLCTTGGILHLTQIVLRPKS